MLRVRRVGVRVEVRVRIRIRVRVRVRVREHFVDVFSFFRGCFIRLPFHLVLLRGSGVR